ncbi:VCBS repeat-containing protein [bacterium]|nr:VCBS repeat-containing protein [bacterium]
MKRLTGVVLLVGFLLLLSQSGMSATVFKKHVINAESICESAGVLDVNRDGILDILSGEYWYEGPTWKKHFVRKIEVKDTYTDDFATVPLDVNGDGWTDVVSVTWFSKKVSWIQNPAGKDSPWTEHVVDNPGNCETAVACDVDGDGTVDVLPNVMGQTVWYGRAGRGKKATLTKHVVDSARGGHGLGFGDVNGDGRGDIVTPFGWYEAPADRHKGKWLLHNEFDLGAASIPIQVHDFNGDGLADIFWGMGHNYGVLWLEQGKSPDGKRTWTRHLIEKSWSQPHAIILADLDGDGKPEAVTGKRYHAHNGHDPGGNEPLIVCYYKWSPEKKAFEKHVIDEGTKTGFGIYPTVTDIDGDGDIDIIAPGKSGLYLFENLRLK